MDYIIILKFYHWLTILSSAGDHRLFEFEFVRSAQYYVNERTMILCDFGVHHNTSLVLHYAKGIQNYCKILNPVLQFRILNSCIDFYK